MPATAYVSSFHLQYKPLTLSTKGTYDTTMASEILGNITEKAKSMAGAQNKKVAQLSADTKDVHDPSYRITSDYGVKQHDTDHWLAAVSDDKQGPQLLEDPFGREKVRQPLPYMIEPANLSLPVSPISKTNFNRSTASIMNAFRNELFTLAVRELSANSLSLSRLQMSPRLAF